mgnify:CR=1 FL=1
MAKKENHMGFMSKLLSFGSDKDLKRYYKIVDQINGLEPQFEKMTEEELRGQTDKFRERYANGESLDDMLPEAFATVREASKRTMGMRHFDVQLIGAMALHEGHIAEMKTGEGKTLVSTLAGYLNAIAGKGVHVVTVNDYLAKRDSEWMGRIYKYLGMTVGLLQNNMPLELKRPAYQADVTYGTNSEFGFDYLRDNMVTRPEQRVQRGHNYAIVDEVDSILIDEARTPLIISGAGTKSASTYKDFARAVRGLERGEDVSHDMLTATEDVEPTGDYVMDEAKHTIAATERGLKKIERRLGIDDIYADLSGQLVNHLQQALKAQYMFHRDKQYVVTNGEVKIVDEFTGRIMEGRCYSEGLHQAIEAKEGVLVREENQTLATITLQNYFRLYDKLSGMTGTALTEDAEFREIYKLPVEVIPSNKPVQRVDHEDLVYRTIQAKYNAVADDVEQRHAKGQPVLVGTVSIESSEKLSAALAKRGIAHEVLNAKHHEREAHIVAQAGRYGAVTIATNMAGRGTDILLGGNPDELVRERLEYEGLTMEDVTPEQLEQFNAEAKETCKAERERVLAAGGLTVIGTERHESRRIDNQLRGRSGRQGDPGESRFYLSLEDDLMRLFNTQLVARVMAKGMPEGEPIEAKSVSKGVRTAQKAVESRNFEIRKNVLKYDDVMNKQRTVIYAERQAVLKGADIHEDILKFIDDTVLSYIKGANNGSDKPADWDWDGLFKAISSVYPIAVEQEAAKDAVDKLKGDKAVEALKELIVSDAKDQYSDFEDKLGSEGLRQLERRVVLAVLDRKWREHLYEMDYLKDGIGLRGMGQRDPLVEYQREGYQMYNSMIEAIKEETIQLLFHVDIERVAMTEDEETESDEDEAVNAAEAVMGLDGEAAATGESAPAEPETDDEAEKTTIDELADEQKNEKGIVGMQPISHAEGKVPANKRPKSEELHSPWADGRTFPGTGKNAQCPCGSGRKYKMCHGQNEQ